EETRQLKLENNKKNEDISKLLNDNSILKEQLLKQQREIDYSNSHQCKKKKKIQQILLVELENLKREITLKNEEIKKIQTEIQTKDKIILEKDNTVKRIQSDNDASKKGKDETKPNAAPQTKQRQNVQKKAKKKSSLFPASWDSDNEPKTNNKKSSLFSASWDSDNEPKTNNKKKRDVTDSPPSTGWGSGLF
ncbi:hypothetical protein RFI_31014, partial [Reticulomyxa filosa]